MKKLYLIPLLCLFSISLAFSKCGCGSPGCGGCSTAAVSQSAGEDWRACCNKCDCTKMGHCCDDCGCDIPADAFVEQDDKQEEVQVEESKEVKKEVEQEQS